MTPYSLVGPTFSVIIPTRDRALLFERTLQSVLQQDIDDYEVIVVNDGSSGTELVAYQALEQELDPRVRCHHLPLRKKGHGPAYSRNFGAAQATGQYLCFLDDDDLWIDPSHLRRCRNAVLASDTPVDLYFTNQKAVFPDGRLNPDQLWISGVERELVKSPDAAGNHRITLPTLLRTGGFAHLNCSIYRRSFFEAIDGMDEALRYEEDRDVYWRAVDAAELMLYNPCVIAQHHIPDSNKAHNASTVQSDLEKKIFQLRICDKAIVSSRQEATRQHARHFKGYILKGMAKALIASGRKPEAIFYMREALSISFSFKWLVHTVLSAVGIRFSPQRH